MEKLAIVLGAGSSRGALQAGALEALLEAGIMPDMLVGSSVGALNAAYFAANPSIKGINTLKQIYKDVEFSDIIGGGNFKALVNLIRQQTSLFGNGSLQKLLLSHMPVRRFFELVIPCYVTATDIDTAELHIFGDDPDDHILDALMSSAAIIPIQPPYELGGKQLGDGGMKTLLPIEVALERGATEIIALNLSYHFQTAEERQNAFNMLLHALDLLSHSQVERELRLAAVCYPDVPVHCIDLNGDTYVPLDETSRAEELIEKGYQYMQEELKTIELKTGAKV